MTADLSSTVLVTPCLMLMTFTMSAEEQSVTISHTHWRRTELSDIGVKFEGHKAEYASSSLPSCALRCLSNQPCLSFSLHRATRRCFVFPSRVMFGVDMVRLPGFTHYWRVYSECPSSSGYDYVPSAHVCYRPVTSLADRKSWLNASWACEADSGHLYIASTRLKMDVISNFITDSNSVNLQFKLGGTDRGEEGWFRWLDGSQVVTWYSGQPDNRDGDQHCMENTRGHPGYTSDGKCATRDRYICQIPLY
ncbi:C-type lectin lectoxin-Enh4-like [Littorina saxatilis]|uniref:C-type lectin lectoxin-Enh4-like n=1 Tax=Littorina saxatilis TaxID=31220 RepID=UPI0038B48570